MNMSIVEFILTSALCYLCGVGTGLSICCHYKERFMSRQRSHDNLSAYNHHTDPFPSVQALPTAPTVHEITVKT